MRNTGEARAVAIAKQANHSATKRVTLAIGLTAAALMWAAGQAKAQETVITSHGISTFDELSYPADFPHLDYVNPDAPKGGEISLSAFGGFDSMNPYTTKGRAAGLASVFFETVLTSTADDATAAYCLLCETMEYPEDRSWVIFNLRPEAKFSDGTPLTAEDVAFSYDTFLTKGLPSFRAVLSKQVDTVEVLDTHKIKFTFKAGEPTRDLPQAVGGLPVFSKADFETNGWDLEESTLETFVGSGPYVLDNMDVGKRIVYQRDPDYWGADVPINIGRNNFDKIRLEYYGDYNAAFEGFKAGDYTFRNEASSKQWATGYDFPALEKGHVVKAELPDGDISTGQSFIFNLRREQFQDPRVRQAIGLLFNFEWSNDTLFYGLYQRTTSFWDNSYLKAEGVPSADELTLLTPLVEQGLLPETILTDEAVVPPVSSDRQLDRRNLRAASALLDEAGWTVGDDGMRRNANGDLLRVAIMNDSQTFERVINPFVENMRRAGIDASLEKVDSAQQVNRERAYDFDMITEQFPMSFVPGSGLAQYFGSETADSSVFNKMGLKSAAVDALIDHVKGAETQEQLNIAVHALDRVLRAELFWVPQWFKPVHTVAYFDMYEHPETLPPYSLGQLDFWWYNAEKAEKLKAEGAL